MADADGRQQIDSAQMRTFTPTPPSKDPAIRLLDHLPSDRADDAAALYLTALGDKLAPVFGTGTRARQALAVGFHRFMCISALEQDRLAGILGIQTASAGFMAVRLAVMRQYYGVAGSLWRMALLALLHHTPSADAVHIDGVAVAPAYRRRGIGSRLIAAMENWATGQGFTSASLEVVDSNPLAQKLYQRLGFEAVREQTVWPFGTLFRCNSSTLMVKSLI
jgi:ribosomal protein S18 acetylase RimI-like enzyme